MKKLNIVQLIILNKMEHQSRNYYTKESNVIMSVLKLQEIIDNHIHVDEMVSNYLVVPIEKIQQSLTNLEKLLIIAFDSPINKKNIGFDPLRDLVKVMEDHIEKNEKNDK